MVIEGKLFAKLDTVQVSETFTKRDFVVEFSENPLYPQVITFQVVQDRVSIIDNFNVGDTVEVAFNLRGREWTSPQGEKKYFNTLEAWRVQKGKATEGAGSPPSTPSAQVADISSGAADDLPF